MAAQQKKSKPEADKKKKSDTPAPVTVRKDYRAIRENNKRLQEQAAARNAQLHAEGKLTAHELRKATRKAERAEDPEVQARRVALEAKRVRLLAEAAHKAEEHKRHTERVQRAAEAKRRHDQTLEGLAVIAEAERIERAEAALANQIIAAIHGG